MREQDLKIYLQKVQGQPEKIQQLIRELNGAQYQYRSTPLIPLMRQERPVRSVYQELKAAL